MQSPWRLRPRSPLSWIAIVAMLCYALMPSLTGAVQAGTAAGPVCHAGRSPAAPESAAALLDALGPHCLYCFIGGLSGPPAGTEPRPPAPAVRFHADAPSVSVSLRKRRASNVAARGPPFVSA